METPRGRWFLDEYAARLRNAEMNRLSDGLQRLEAGLAANHNQVMTRLAEVLRRDPSPSGSITDLQARHMRYFRGDENIFEPAPDARVAAVGPATSPFRFPAAATMPEQRETGPLPNAKRRIVLIRHKPGEAIDVPLADDLAEAS